MSSNEGLHCFLVFMVSGQRHAMSQWRSEPVKMELDTNASINLVYDKMWKESIPLVKSKVVLRAYSDPQHSVLGKIVVTVEAKL